MKHSAIVLFAGLCLAIAAPATAQQAQQPPYSVTKVEGTDNVYIFRYQGHQSMFVVTRDGVIATDPISYGRPQAAKAYIEEIQKITKAPIKYLVYSHQHYDHISGGKPFKDAGATVIAHRKAKERLAQHKFPDVVIPDQVVDGKRTIRLGGTTVDLVYVGRNHSDNSLVMHLPKEKIVFAVDFIGLAAPSARGMGDAYPVEWEESVRKVLAMPFEKFIPGHPGPGGKQVGTRADVETVLKYLADLSAATRQAALEGKCFDAAEKDVRLPQFANFAGYEQAIVPGVTRYCGYWGRAF